MSWPKLDCCYRSVSLCSFLSALLCSFSQCVHLIDEKVKNGKMPTWVQQYNRACSLNMRVHLVSEHGAVEEEEVPMQKQTKLAQSLDRGEVARADSEIKVALAIAFNPTMTFRMVSDHFFVQAFGNPVGRQRVPLCILRVKNLVLESMKKQLSGAQVTVCLDGWTNSYTHRKMLNILILHLGRAVFWRTIPMRLGKSAPVLFAMMRVAVEEMEAVLGVAAVGCVADNESSNRGLFGLLTTWRPWMICLGCAQGLMQQRCVKLCC